ncbi:DUF202 domain-containing protein [Pseudonocardia kunmingensis]|uniref:Uncharacterized protein DUF202 n=1 Tax=Pseudonocardia kunmingensis TaxID=630975 RepID=A0A543DL46_9PSEU|nr:DUF202 domain-containing protein [Pseudonocardia kunmingensis]TQM10038.1 uncharacterized protein DUF202 [Pseudonocardia kunmingensis]
MSQPALFDPGLQPERTLLAWRRTVLSLAVGSLVALRVLPPVLGEWAIGPGVVGVVLSGVLWVLAGRRAAAGYRALRDGSAALPGGGLLLFLGVVVAAAGAVGLWWAVG